MDQGKITILIGSKKNNGHLRPLFLITNHSA